jgi:hypothetical protein
MKNYGVKLFSVIAVSIIFLMSSGSFAEAACGGANCSVLTGSQNGLVAKDRVVMDLSYRYVLAETPHHGSSRTNRALTPKVNFATGTVDIEEHDEKRTINELVQFDVSYGVTDKLTLSLNVPMINDRLHEHQEAAGGAIKNNNGTSGFGDITLVAKYPLLQTTKHSLIGGAGVKFATGEYQLHDAEGNINEPTIQPGTGSYDVILSGLHSYSAIPNSLNLFTSVSHRFTSENDKSYEFGDITLVNVGANYNLSNRVNVSGQLNLRVNGKDKFFDVGVPGTGGEFLFVTPGVRFAVRDGFSIYSHVQLPLYQRVNESNLVTDYAMMLGASIGF